MAMSRMVSASDPQCLYIDHSAAEANPPATVARRFEVENLARIIDRVGVDQQRSDDAAKLQQGVPVPTIARQPRRLNAEDRANPPIAECAQEPFKAWP